MDTTRRHTALTLALRLCIVAIGLSSAACAAPGPAIDDSTRNEAISSAAAQLDRAYVFPAKAKAMGADLRMRLRTGKFDGLDGNGLAEAMTKALREVSHDGHLEVRYMADAVPAASTSTARVSPEVSRELIHQRRLNHGFSSVERLKGNLGYIDLHEFGRPGVAAPRIAGAMALLADTDTLIIDLRECDGGDPETVMAFASYLYDKPTHLNDVYWQDEKRLEARWTQARVDGKRYGETRPVYLLTSSETFSSCEDLAYAMKNNHRAVIVGETTGGGAHAGSPQRLGAHFMMFVPTGRPINPVTQSNWEGVGVVPDVAVSADKALDTAQVAALTALAGKVPDARWKEALEKRIAELD